VILYFNPKNYHRELKRITLQENQEQNQEFELYQMRPKIFMRFGEQKSVLTKDNMLSRNWQGDLGVSSMGYLKLMIIYFLSAL
jgi:hypothetical protein